MGTLSNLPWLRALRGWNQTAPVETRPARPEETEPAVRLIVGSLGGFAEQAAIKEFVRLAETHRGDAGGLRVADQAGRLISAVLPIASPGRTLVVLPPAQLNGEVEEAATRLLVEEICQLASRQGIHLMQALLETTRPEFQALFATCSFKRLAELLYMQASVPRNMRPANLPPGCSLQTYSPQTHDLFARTILASYQQSLDCPALNGLRDIPDIMAGHRATGEFDPKLWFVLCDTAQPLGVLLLSPMSRNDAIELVYLGVPPAARGRGAGDLLMRHAMATISASRYTRLSLAVDAINMPALKLYWRHGLQAIGRKLAMLRDLRTAPPL